MPGPFCPGRFAVKSLTDHGAANSDYREGQGEEKAGTRTALLHLVAAESDEITRLDP